MSRPLRSRRQRQPKNRRGVVTVEMAICLPVLFIIFMGSIDLIRYNLLRNVVSQATYEAARTALVRGATMTEVQAAANSTIQTHDPNLTYTLTVTPADLSTSSDTITVTVDANLRNGGWIVSKQILGSNMSETLVLKRN